MEEKQKVWIKVPKGKKKEAVDILKNRGGRYTFDFDAENLSGDVLFIDHDGNIDSANARSEFARMLEDYYTEIMIDEPWKDGDILVRADRNGKEFVVFKEIHDDNFFSHYPLFNGDNTTPLPAENYRKAMAKEVRMFNELLASNGEEWDEVKKRVVRKVFKPLHGQTFYYVFWSGDVMADSWGQPGIYQTNARRFGNCFETRKEAVRAARKIRALLLDADDEDREK